MAPPASPRVPASGTQIPGPLRIPRLHHLARKSPLKAPVRMDLESSGPEPEEGSGVGATRGGRGLWSRDPRCPAGAVLTAQAIGHASVVRWLQRVVQGRVRGDGLVFRGALAA